MAIHIRRQLTGFRFPIAIQVLAVSLAGKIQYPTGIHRFTASPELQQCGEMATFSGPYLGIGVQEQHAAAPLELGINLPQ